MDRDILDIKELLNEEYGSDMTERYQRMFTDGRRSSLRVNRILSSADEISSSLDDKCIGYGRVSWYDDAFSFDPADEPLIRDTDIYREGKIYLQSLSAMIPVLVLDPREGESVLDMCAAPGGKTTQIAAVTSNRSQITACEKQHKRAERLRYNLDRQGVKNAYVMETDALKLDDLFRFDRILLDAPCSGSGTFEKEEDFCMHKVSFFRKLNETQKKLAVKAASMLKKGGEMVYSTCSVLREENEDVIRNLTSKVGMDIVPIDETRFEGIQTLKNGIDGTLTIMPDENYEGFFVCRLKKR